MQVNFTNKVYDVLKWITLVVIPALAGFYLGLSSIWAFPDPQFVVGVMMALDAFLGVLLSVATKTYDASVGPKVDFIDDKLFQDMIAWSMTKKAYEDLKWLAQIGLPSVATLYFTLAAPLGLPYPDQVVATIAALDGFLGLALQFNTAQYKVALAASKTKALAPK